MGKDATIARARSPRNRSRKTPGNDLAPVAGEIVTVVVTDGDRVVSVESGTIPESPAPVLTSVPRSDEITVDGAALKRALALITGVADKKATMPILRNVALRSGADGVEATATDLSVYLTVRLATGNGSARCGTTVEAHALAALVKTLPSGEIAIGPKDGHATIAAGPVTGRLTAIPDRDYPKIPSYTDAWITVDARALKSAIGATLFSTCKDGTRFHLAGALLASDGNALTMVTTDGHRLTKYHAPWSWSGPSLAKGVIVPSAGLTQLRKILNKADTCEVGLKAPYLFVRTESATLAIKLTDAQFPPYEQVIPKANTRQVTVDRAAFLAALKRARLLTCETSGACFEIESGKLTVVAVHPDNGEVRDAIACDYQGPDFRWGCNPKYVIELCEEIDDASITMGFAPESEKKAHELDPASLRGTDDAAMRPLCEARILGVVMPMRI